MSTYLTHVVNGWHISLTLHLQLGTYDITEAILYNDLSNIGKTCYSCRFRRGAIVTDFLHTLFILSHSLCLLK